MSASGGTPLLSNETVNDGFFDRYGDPRVRDWFLMESPVPLLGLIAFYLLFCTKIGPRMMQNRKPFELKKAMILYNFLNVLACLHIIRESYMVGYYSKSLTCQHIDYSNHPQAVRMARGAWFYFQIKNFDLLDTVFFVLRKKNNQITFLHLYHHSVMSLSTWAIAKFWPGGHVTFSAVLNSIVHVIMYSYYLLAALGPKYQKYLWWKKYVTIIQLVQFVAVLIHQGQVFFNGCDISKIPPLYFCLNTAFFLCLFIRFYVKTYIKKREKKAA